MPEEQIEDKQLWQMMDQEILKKGKLSKKFFMELPDGVYIASNCQKIERGKYKSIYTGKVLALAKREIQWKEIVKASADQNLCYVFSSEESYKMYSSVLSSLMERQFMCRASRNKGSLLPR